MEAELIARQLEVNSTEQKVSSTHTFLLSTSTSEICQPERTYTTSNIVTSIQLPKCKTNIVSSSAALAETIKPSKSLPLLAKPLFSNFSFDQKMYHRTSSTSWLTPLHEFRQQPIQLKPCAKPTVSSVLSQESKEDKKQSNMHYDLIADGCYCCSSKKGQTKLKESDSRESFKVIY